MNYYQLNLNSVSRFPKEVEDDLSSKQIVGVGEVAHGSRGLHEAAVHICKVLVEHLGFKTIFLEAPQEAVEILADQQSRVNLDQLYYVWRSEEILELFRWVKNYNKGRQEPVELIGCDIRQPSSQLKLLIQALARTGISSSKLEGFFLDEVGGIDLKHFRDYESRIYRGGTLIPKGRSAEISEILKEINLKVKAIVHSDDLGALIRQYLDDLLCWTRMYLVHEVDVVAMANVRDDGMFSKIKSQVEMKPDHPCLIIAHLGHLIYQNDRITSRYKWLEQTKFMGSKFKAHFGERYSLVGLLSQEISASVNEGMRFESFKTLPESIENLIKVPQSLPSLIDVNNSKDSTFTATQKVGYTNGLESPLKEIYPDFEAKLVEQMDYVVLLKDSKSV